ncbi:MAG: hypothetical protein WA252_03165 [Candidatus Sulfotelmatobacter sp.]|jgi:hypothetical protein
MACITMLAPRMAMATTQLTRETPRKVFVPIHFEQTRERTIPRMNWVVVTGSDGSPSLRMNWTTDGS